MTNAKVCGNCWHSSPSGTCRKHGAPITPNSTCDSYVENPYVYDVFIDGELVDSTRFLDFKTEAKIFNYLGYTWVRRPTQEHKPTDGAGSDPKPAQCPGQSCDHPGCPRANNGEFDHSGYYRYIPQQSGTDSADDEGDPDVQLEEVVRDVEWIKEDLDDMNTRLNNYRSQIYKLEDRADVNDSWAESLIPVLVIAYIGNEVAIASGAGVIALVIAFCLLIYYIAFMTLRKDARDK